MSVRVMIAVPSPMVGEGLKSIINGSQEYTVAGVVPDMQSCVERMPVMAPDIVMVDTVLLAHGSRSSVSIYNAYPELQERTVVGIVTGACDDELLRQFDGTVNLYDGEMQILRKLRAALRSHDSSPHKVNNEISEREREILVLVASGMTNKEIADRLNISVHTVIAHRKNISHKTGIKSVAGLTVYALMNSMIDRNAVVL